MPSSEAPVFFDPSGRRARKLRFATGLVAGFAFLLLLGFAASIVIAPQFRPLAERTEHAPHAPRRLAFRREHPVVARYPQSSAKSAIDAGARIYGAYFGPWQDGGLDSLRQHASDLTHVYPAWLQVGEDGRSLRSVDWNPRTTPTTLPLMHIAHDHHLRVAPTLSNAANGHFDSARVEHMLETPHAAQGMIDQLVQFVDANDLDGLQLDIEFLNARMRPAYFAWVDALARALHAHGKELSAAIQVSDDAGAIRAMAHATDYVVAMAYDEHVTPGAPGPVASAGFVQDVLRRFTANVPANKLVLGVGAYGYDWASDGSEPQSVTNAEAIAEAAGYRENEKAQDVIDFDATALEPTFTYTDDNNLGHEVWFLDGVTVANTLRLAAHYPTRGAALWALGMEDATTWRVFSKNAAASPDLHTLAPPNTPEFIGDGELLTVRRTPANGERSYDISRRVGLIDDEHYLTYPTSWLVSRQGNAAGLVALTFDDGPDPRWTPQILDVLRRRGVKATFFMIGQSAVAYPDIVRRIAREGHEIGNHSFTHPNMAHVGPERVRLELTATQRAIESIVGRSTRLFRPPFNADADPATDGEITPIWIANQAGYLAADESIDPQDWMLSVRSANGETRRLTADDIVSSVVQQADRGHAILLHDGGGDRSATVAAIDKLITALQARGCRFVTMGELANLPETTTMPRLNAADHRMAEVDHAFFWTWRGVSAILFWGFTAAIALGLARIALMLFLASRNPAKRLLVPAAAPRRADVLIAAYNEQAVIASTLKSVLASKGAAIRVILVDDGSTDATLEIAREFSGDPRLLILTKPNGGKASALNLALAHASADIVVGIDADTQIAPGAIAALVARFDDPEVGAVAGNVRVGNRINILTRWQAIEYITSQNIDRVALARVNAITVVPGAIGAWRTSAVRDTGGYSSDTLAEDMDLTWRLRRAGWRIVNEASAIAHTEAPATLGALMRQRFRWTFGTLQCLWKHREALFHYGWFGGLALPTLWLFQIVMQVLAPLTDLQLLIALFARTIGWLESLQHSDIAPPYDPAIWIIIAIYFAFVALELAAAWVAFELDDEDKQLLWLQPLQRLVYRQIMYIAVWRAVLRAAAGASHAWGKLHRAGSVKLAHADHTDSEGLASP